jgi:glycosyltransferase involved in cell wall biosynthesis
MGILVFVTTELSPFTPGGIGRVVHNLLKSMPDEDQRRAWVVALDCALDTTTFNAVFPFAGFMPVDSNTEAGRHEHRGHHPPRWAFSDTDWHWKSTVVLRALRKLSQTVPIDYVEFPDWGALGFATVQEKKISGFLDNATLAVRLHSSESVLLQHEAHPVHNSDMCLVDLERKTLRDCDLLIAQLGPVAEHMRQIFGFERHEWEPRLVRHAPPVLLDTREPVKETIAANNGMPIIFGSKIQQLKRPDLFIRGSSAFCRANPHYSGNFLISAHCFDQAFGDAMRRLVPPDLSKRFRFDAPGHSTAREPLIATSTFVVPSDIESFCLAAFEASLLGARVILNGANPAFGDDTPWQDGINCYKFDGSVHGLRKALERNFDDKLELHPVTNFADPWPWNTQIVSQEIIVKSDRPLVSVIVPHFNLGKYLQSTLLSVLEQTYDNIEIIVIDDYSTDAASRVLINNLQSGAYGSLKIVTPPGNVGLAAARNLAVENAAGEYILPLDADDLIDRRFVEVAVRALERNPSFDVFVTPAGYFHDGDDIVLPGQEKDFKDYAVFFGEALVSGVKQNRFSTATAVFRADVLRKHSYTESLRCYEDWGLYVRLAQAGHRFLVANDVYFHYRNRANSMVKSADQDNQHLAFQQDMLRTSANVRRSVPLAYLVFCDRRASMKQAEPVANSAAPKDTLASLNEQGSWNDEQLSRLLLSATQQKIVVLKSKQILLSPIASARRRYRKKLRELVALRDQLKLRLTDR